MKASVWLGVGGAGGGGWRGKEGSFAPRDSEARPTSSLPGRRKLPGGVGNLSRERGSPPPLPSVLGLVGLPSTSPAFWQRTFSSGVEGRDLGRLRIGAWAGAAGVGFPARYKSLPSLNNHPHPEPHEASNESPQSGPRPSAPFPLFPRISGGGPGSARGRTFFAKKGKDAAARAAGTSGSDSRHEWVTAPPHRDSRAGAGMSPGGGGCPPK